MIGSVDNDDAIIVLGAPLPPLLLLLLGPCNLLGKLRDEGLSSVAICC